MVRKNTDFIGGMFSGARKAQASSVLHYFDFDKALEIIKEKKPDSVEAGLAQDWSHTSGYIMKDGKLTNDDYTYLHSRWATPSMTLIYTSGHEEEIDCFRTIKDDEEIEIQQKWTNKQIKEFNKGK